MPRKPKSEPERRQVQYPGLFPYATAKGTHYRCAFDVPPALDSKRRTWTKRRFLSEQDAWDAMQEEKRRLRATGYADPMDETLQQYYACWMCGTQAGRRHASNGAYARAWVLLPEPFRALPLARITSTQVRNDYDQLVPHYALATCRLTLTLLVMVLADAHRDHLIPGDPAQDVRLPISRDAEAEARFDPANVWTVAEARR